MAAHPRKLPYANPFYFGLVLVSAAFLLTTFGYLASPALLKPAPGLVPPSPASRAVADWLDRNGPAALAWELALMIVGSILAMTTDRWFTGTKAVKKPKYEDPGEAR